MKVAKKVVLNNKINTKLKSENGKFIFLFRTENGESLTQYSFKTPVVLKKSNFYFINNLSKNNYLNIFNQLQSNIKKLFSLKYCFFGKLHMIGLGFKNFVLDNKLYILVGDCNYIIFDIPETLKIYCKKNQIYILSISNKEAFDFISHIKKIKTPNFYKGKGILEFKNFKFTKLKVGKKQRFA